MKSSLSQDLSEVASRVAPIRLTQSLRGLQPKRTEHASEAPHNFATADVYIIILYFIADNINIVSIKF